MHQPLPARDILRDPAIAPHAASAGPVWLFDMDGSRLHVRKSGGGRPARLFQPAPAAAGTQVCPSGLAAQIGRIGATLAPGGHPQLARLRGLGLSLGRPLTCACSAIADRSRRPRILVRAVEAAGPTLSLAERARRLIEGRDGALAAFGPDGTLLHATARRRTTAERRRRRSNGSRTRPRSGRSATGRTRSRSRFCTLGPRGCARSISRRSPTRWHRCAAQVRRTR